MSNVKLIMACFLYGIVFCASFAHADDIVNDDLIIQGSECVGFDCVNGIDFLGNTLLLRENNLRIRLHDISASDGLGQSWSVTANSSANFGKSNFQFELKSLTMDNIRLSDGTAPLYDCSVSVPIGSSLPPIIGVIPFGEPATSPQNVMPDGAGGLIYECLTLPDYTIKPILSLGTSVDRGVTLGFDSFPEPDAISVGNSNLVRNLKNVAAGIADTDILIQKFINDFPVLADQQVLLTTLQAQMALLDSEISLIEDKVFNNNAATTPELVSPSNEANNVAVPVTLSWNDSSDVDGDTIQYSVTICENQDFTGCAAEVVAVTDFSMVVAGLGSGTGLLLWMGIMLPSSRNRKSQWMTIICLLSAATLMVSCGSGSSGSKEGTQSFIAAGLSPNTQYFWKVTATDFIDNTDSEVRNFTTQ